MNPRIKQLAGQAGYYQEQDVDGSRFDAMPRQCFEKFAELIVRECTLQVADVRIENNFEPVGDAVLVRVLAGIKKHFGVEE